ncbi:MAG: hypothetical protein IJ583_02710 [Firmicutes bacterium]|nr:hypothetical protein [Bacillota bacterium]
MKKNTLKRIGSAFLAVALFGAEIPVNIDIFGLSNSFLQTVLAEEPKAEISYIYRSWDTESKKVIEETRTCSDYTDVAEIPDQIGTGFGEGWYVLKESREFQNRLTITGNTHLLLCDGATLTCHDGIRLSVNVNHGDVSLSVYSQEKDSGSLICEEGDKGQAGIGGNAENEHCGDVTVYGGKVEAHGAKNAAGIGGGSDGMNTPNLSGGCGSAVTIYGGTVEAYAGEYGAGIGGGKNGDQHYSKSTAGFIMYGGNVTAHGGGGAGIGGGCTLQHDGNNARRGNHTGTIIYGGKVNAQSFAYGGAGIGTGGTDDYSQTDYHTPTLYGDIVIKGGVVDAKGAKHGSGIGGGEGNVYYSSVEKKIIIEGGEVNAEGGEGASGIGGGYAGAFLPTIISGGIVKAKACERGAGIGSCENGIYKYDDMDDHTTVFGELAYLQITGGEVYATGLGAGAGIGGSFDLPSFNGGVFPVSITGGKVTAWAGSKTSARLNAGSCAIGDNDDSLASIYDHDKEKSSGKLTIGDDMKVTAGDSPDNIERVFPEDGKVYACRWRDYVEIEKCDHRDNNGSDMLVYHKDESFDYVKDADGKYVGDCPYCGQEIHIAEVPEIVRCTITIYPEDNGGTSTVLTDYVEKEKMYILPDPTDMGLELGTSGEKRVFNGWKITGDDTLTQEMYHAYNPIYPEKDITLKAVYVDGYTFDADVTGEGKVRFDRSVVPPYGSVGMTLEPAEGYELKEVYGGGTASVVQRSSDDPYSYVVYIKFDGAVVHVVYVPNTANSYKAVEDKENIGYCVDEVKGNLYLVYTIPNGTDVSGLDHIAIKNMQGEIIKPLDDGSNTGKDGAEDGKIHTVYKSVKFPDGSILTAAQADSNAEYIVAFEVKERTTLPDDFQIVME